MEATLHQWRLSQEAFSKMAHSHHNHMSHDQMNHNHMNHDHMHMNHGDGGGGSGMDMMTCNMNVSKHVISLYRKKRMFATNRFPKSSDAFYLEYKKLVYYI